MNKRISDTELEDGEGSPSLSTCAAITMAWKYFENPTLFEIPIPLSPIPSPHRASLMQAFFHLTRILSHLLRGDFTDILYSERELLLWPATLPPSLSFVNREMSSAESCLLHVLHNAIACWYYTSRLPDSQQLLLEPNEATLLFLATLGCSCVKTWTQHGRGFADVWGNIFVMSISIVIQQICFLVLRFDCQNSKGVLILFLSELSIDDGELFGDQLISEVAATIGLPLGLGLKEIQDILRSGLYGASFKESGSNGATVYWVFRDMRNMTLKALRRGQ
ncbi:hypothetical protein N7456_002166 [Penicillium angulare]|uniref:Uncharacterized protein n=1 Tax=Penicillium angulare TaxID=116970 RepID=A0A9W9G8Y7_9EURO|nr:hypothetical protein N7456_002166 [Penicillium angulare]